MLRHVVMWRIDDGRLADGRAKKAVASDLCAQLVALKNVVPGVLEITAGADCVEAAGNWDFALVVDVADEQALSEYAAHPAHLEVVDRIKSVVSQRAAADFRI